MRQRGHTIQSAGSAAAKTSRNARSDLHFSRRKAAALSLLAKRFRFLEQPSAWRAWPLVVLLVATVLLQLWVQYRLNFWNRDFFDAIGRRDAAGVWEQALRFVPLAAAQYFSRHPFGLEPDDHAAHMARVVEATISTIIGSKMITISG